MLDRLWQGLVLKGCPELPLKVPTCEHPVGNLLREAVQVFEGKPHLPLRIPALPLPTPALQQVFHIVGKHSDAPHDVLEKLIGDMQQHLEGSDALALLQSILVRVPQVYVPGEAQVRGIVGAAPEGRTAAVQHQLGGTIPRQVKIEEPPLVQVASSDELVQHILGLLGRSRTLQWRSSMPWEQDVVRVRSGARRCVRGNCGRQENNPRELKAAVGNALRTENAAPLVDVNAAPLFEVVAAAREEHLAAGWPATIGQSSDLLRGIRLPFARPE
mmetsp:Transcript_48084/g.155125  ORF Transcript_48084/g.155125 Transcript_48084/m.155125 type:complete len:272 (-) Transcript_48084:1027-1842(-)